MATEPLFSVKPKDPANSYLCPSCKKPLTVTENLGTHETGAPISFMYCSRGKCTSVKSNEGATGLSLDEAFRKLEAEVLNEVVKE